MRSRRNFTAVVLLICAPGAGGIADQLVAAESGSTVSVSAAARVGNWKTDLWVANVNDRSTEVEMCWLDRSVANTPDDCGPGLVIPAGVVEYFPDVILNDFFMEEATGAIIVRGEDEVAVWARMYADSSIGTFGQGFEGIPTDVWWTPGMIGMIPGVISGRDFRTNFFALAGADGAILNIRFQSGQVAFDEYQLELGPWMPILRNIRLFLQLPSVENAVGHLVVEVVHGHVIFGGSVIDNGSNDPSTLQPILRLDSGSGSPTVTPTQSPTSAASSTATPTVAVTSTSTSTPTPHRTPSPTRTPTAEPPTPTRTSTPTVQPPTATPQPPTATPQPPTATPELPTPTRTRTETPPPPTQTPS